MGDEIKLGGNAVSILALVKYTRNDRRPAISAADGAVGDRHCLYAGSLSGQFVHVLNSRDLSLKPNSASFITMAKRLLP